MNQKLIHELKTWPEYFGAVKSGDKTFDIRKGDRNFSVGDELLLREFVPADYYEDQVAKEYYTGQICHKKISYILSGEKLGIKEGYVILGLHTP